MFTVIDIHSNLATHIRKDMTRAIADYNLIEKNDKIMVCVSGGKDSSILLALLLEIRKRAERKFELEAVLLDQKQPGFQVDQYKKWVESLGVKFHLIEKDTYSIVKEKVPVGSTYCSLCSRLRRAILYDFAVDQGFTKMALGHHRDDLIVTTLLNMFYTGNISAMPPKLLSDDKRNIVIRPLCYVSENDLIELSKSWNIPTIPCNLCGSQDGLKRKRIKQIIQNLKTEIPNIEASLLTAISQVKPSQLLDKDLWNFDLLKRAESQDVSRTVDSPQMTFKATHLSSE
jgi:tRNA 2-thiocytidine biosynthesis protein TtcA